MGALKLYSEYLLTGPEVKRSFQENYLKILFSQHYDLDEAYIIDYLHQAQLSGANPVIKQIHLTKYFSKKLGRNVGVAVYSYHFFLSQANLTGEMMGLDVSSTVEEVFDPIAGKEKRELVSTVTVERKGRGKTTFKARWSEFYNANNEGWRTKPYVMLEKTAIANVLRWAFPEVLSGMYIEEEISENNYESAVRIDDPKAIEVSAKKLEEKKEVIANAENSKDITKQANAIKALLNEVKTTSLQEKTQLLKKIGIKTINDLYQKSIDELEEIKEIIEEIISNQKTIVETIVEKEPVEKVNFYVVGKTAEHRITLKTLGGKFNAKDTCWDFFNSSLDVFDKVSLIDGLICKREFEKNVG